MGVILRALGITHIGEDLWISTCECEGNGRINPKRNNRAERVMSMCETRPSPENDQLSLTLVDRGLALIQS